MNRTALQGVLLDVDGTLYSLRRMVLRHPLVMLGLAEFFRQLHQVRGKLRGQKLDDFYGQQARLLAELRGIECEQAKRLIREAVEVRWAGAFRGLRPWRGVRGALQLLRERGLKIGLLSDYPLEAKIEGLGLAALPFDCRVVTERVGALKPHPAGFLLAAEQLGLEPGAILHIGDREDHDVAGALAAGMRAALFCPGRLLFPTRAAFAFKRWRELATRLEHFGWLPSAR